MDIKLCDMCGKIKTSSHSLDFVLNKKLMSKIAKYTEKVKSKGFLAPKDLDDTAKIMKRIHELSITNARVIAIRESELCDKCLEDTLKYFDKMEKKEKIK